MLIGLALVGAVGCRSPTAERRGTHGAPTLAVEVPAVAVVAFAAPKEASAQATKLRLVAHHRLGVPVHEALHDRGRLRRVPDGTEVALLGAAEGNWFHVRLPDGTDGFVTKRYLIGTGGEVPSPARASSPVVRSRGQTCALALERARATPRPAAARVATFNVRWFPDGQPGKKAPESGGTDLPFLACTIATTGAEVVLVQEFKRSARAKASLEKVLGELNRLTAGDWQARFDDCKNESAQHVGVLFDQSRAKPLDPARTLADFNPLGGACTDSLRPGLLQRFRLSSGLETDLISVHFKSGRDARSYGLRQKTLSALREVVGPAGGSIIVGGDLNTMGCDECNPPVSAAAEREQAARAGTPAGLSLASPKGGCSHYYQGKPGLLDGFWIREQQPVEVELGGVCADLACAPLSTKTEPTTALDRVSDHCPLVLSLPVP